MRALHTLAPAIPRLEADQLPKELRARPQWVAWRYAWRRGKWTKAPITPRTGRNADPADPTTWGSFAEALAYAERHHCGIGYVFAADDPYVGVDLDNCRDPQTGELTTRAATIVAELDTYAETSASGTGVHLIARGTLPGPRRKSPQLDHEMYAERRFFVFTGQRLPNTPAAIAACQDALDHLYRATFGPEPAPVVAVSPLPVTGLDDAALLQLAMAAKNGAAFALLWQGDTSAHGGDESAADLALTSHLAYWTGGDAVRVDRLFRQSGLYRPKWERLDYRERTLRKALTRSSFYQPVPPPSDETPAGDTAPLALRPVDDRPAAADPTAAARVAALEREVAAERARRIAAERQVAAAEQRAEQAEQRASKLSQERWVMMRVLGNEHLVPGQRIAAIKLACEYAYQRARPGGLNEGGYAVIRLGHLARKRKPGEEAEPGWKFEPRGLAGSCGLSPESLRRYLATFEQGGRISKTNQIGGKDAEGHPLSDMLVWMEGETVVDILRPFTDFQPELPTKLHDRDEREDREPTSSPADPAACLRCGDTTTITTIRCADCGLIHKEYLIPGSTGQDDRSNSADVAPAAGGEVDGARPASQTGRPKRPPRARIDLLQRRQTPQATWERLAVAKEINEQRPGPDSTDGWGAH